MSVLHCSLRDQSMIIVSRSDYKDIDARYGTLDDWDNLVRGIHDRGLKIMYVA